MDLGYRRLQSTFVHVNKLSRPRPNILFALRNQPHLLGQFVTSAVLIELEHFAIFYTTN